MVTDTLDRQLSQRVSEAAQGLPENTVDATIRLLESIKGRHVREAYAARALMAIAQIVESANDDALINAVGATSDYAVLITTLSQPGVLAKLAQTDPLAPARIRGLELREHILTAEGGTWSAAQVADFLHLSRQAVDHRRKQGKLIAILVGKRAYRFPAWQFGPQGVLPGLENVLEELREYDPWMKAIFMLSPNALLDNETPLETLRRGHVEPVRKAAHLHGEQTAR